MATRDQAATRDGRPARSGFTLVELLVVIMIIAMLAALVTPAVMRAQASARNAQIKAEIDMLHTAMMNYKVEYGSFPPAFDTSPAGSPGLVNRHLTKLFPRATSPIASTAQVALVTPASALNVWLTGYTSDPLNPITPASDRQKLFIFDQSRLASLDNSSSSTFANSRFVYYASGKKRSPYIYINSAAYGPVAAPQAYTVATYYVLSLADAITPSPAIYRAELQTLPAGVNFFNPDTFQILSAGRDEQWGTDDDLSNFWPGTRKDYLDSLK
jgi:prepilin-type N-terminal cleavage/methylation domain-containing protein